MITRRLNYVKVFSTYQRTLFPSKNLFRRRNQQIFMAKHRDEEFSTSENILIKEYRNLTDVAIKHADEEEFIRISFSFINELRKLPKNSILSCDFKGLYYSPSSHVYDGYKSILSKAFQKSLCAAGHPLSTPLNHSGYYITGPSGIGKSLLLQVCALITGQLLPTYISFYANSTQMSSQSIRHLLIDALNEHLPVSNHIHSDTPMNIALATADSHNIAIGIFIDEAQELYNTTDDWSALHACATSYNTAVFLSGCDAYLPPRVRLTLTDKAYLQSTGDDKGRTSLNTTKISQLSLLGFRHISQYIDYFICRPHRLNKLFPTWYQLYCEIISTTTPTIESIECYLYMLYYQPERLDIQVQVLREQLLLEITRLHCLCGGRIRTIEALGDLASPIDIIGFNPAEIDEVTMNTLRPFVDQIARQGGFDPFNLPVLPIVPASGKSDDAAGDGAVAGATSGRVGGFRGNVNECIRRKLIAYASPDSVTLYSPAVYLFMRDNAPTVYISHADSAAAPPVGKPALKAMVAYIKELPITVCSSHSQLLGYMSQHVDNISVWEQGQPSSSSTNRKIIVFLSKEYCIQVDSNDDSICKRDWHAVQHKLLVNPSDPSIILAYISPFETNVTGSVKSAIVGHLLLPLTDHKSLLMRLC